MDFLVKSGLTTIGLNIQFVNAAFGIQKFIKNPSASNCFMALSMVLYGLSYLPVLMQTTVKNIININSQSKLYLEFLVDNYTAIAQIFVGFAMLFYVLLVQIRFTYIREIILYPSVLDTIGYMCSVLMFLVFSVTLHIVIPVLSPNYSFYVEKYGHVWIYYVIVVENVLGFIFMKQVIENFQELNISAGKHAQKLMSTRLTLIVFSCLFLGCLSFYGYERNEMLLQWSYIFSALVFTITLKYLNELESALSEFSRIAAANTENASQKGHQFYRMSCKFGSTYINDSVIKKGIN